MRAFGNFLASKERQQQAQEANIKLIAEVAAEMSSPPEKDTEPQDQVLQKKTDNGNSQ